MRAVMDRGDRRRFHHPWRIHLTVAAILLAVLYASIVMDAQHPLPPTGPSCTFTEGSNLLVGNEEYSGGLFPKRECVVHPTGAAGPERDELRYDPTPNTVGLWVVTILFFQVAGLLAWAVITSLKGAAEQVGRTMSQAAEPPPGD